MEKTELYYQVALMRYRETCQQDRDLDLGAGVVFVLSILLAATASIVMSVYASSDVIGQLGRLYTVDFAWDIEGGIAAVFFTISFVVTFGMAMKTLSIRLQKETPDVSTLTNDVRDSSMNSEEVTQSVGDQFIGAVLRNMGKIAQKSRWLMLSARALTVTILLLGILTVTIHL